MLGKYISISVHFRTEKHDYKAVRREINPCIFNENPYPFLNLNQLWNAAKEEALK
jgi:hypothetical protein